MNHPLHEQEQLSHSRSSPNLTQLNNITPKKQTPPLPIIGIPEPVAPPPPPTTKNSTIKQLSKVIQKSLNLNLNRLLLIKRKNNNTPQPQQAQPQPQPQPLQFSLSNSSSSQPPNWSAYQLDQQPPSASHSAYLIDNFSIGSLSHPDWNPRHSSGTSSGEFSWRIAHQHDNNSSSASSPRTPSHHSTTHWLGRLTSSRPRTMHAGTNTSDQPTHSSRQLGRKSVSFSAPFSAVRPSTGLRPVFGIPVKEALQLSREDYHGIYGHAQLPTIIYKCGERLKCAEGMASRGIFRINGNVKRMRELEQIFMDPALGYGKHFDITAPKSLIYHCLSPHPPDIPPNSDPHPAPYFSLHDVAGVLRRYLWSLPEPLVPYETTMELVMVRRRLVGRGGMGEQSKRAVIEFEQVLRTQMGREELDVLRYLLELLGQFSVRSSDNLMNGKNLAIVFQPGIMHLSGAEEAPTTMAAAGSTRGSLLSGCCSLRVPASSSDPSRTNSPAGEPGLHEYLGQIDEVQEVLRMLIDHFAHLSALLPRQPPTRHPIIHFSDSPTPLLSNPAHSPTPLSSTLSPSFSLPNSADDGG